MVYHDSHLRLFMCSGSGFRFPFLICLALSHKKIKSWLSSTGGQGSKLPPPKKNWSENNRKISITKEICIKIDFAPLKKFLEESQERIAKMMQ